MSIKFEVEARRDHFGRGRKVICYRARFGHVEADGTKPATAKAHLAAKIERMLSEDSDPAVIHLAAGECILVYRGPQGEWWYCFMRGAAGEIARGSGWNMGHVDRHEAMTRAREHARQLVADASAAAPAA